MKQFGVILAAMLLAISSAFADGTKQLMPNASKENTTPVPTPTPKGNCYLSIAAQEGGESSGNPSRNFARFYRSSDGTTDHSCDTSDALYINIKDPANEVIHFGLGYAYRVTEGTSSTKRNVYVRIKDPCGNVVWPLDASGNPIPAGVNIKDLSKHITTYSQAYYGPKSVNADGYDYFSIKPNPSSCPSLLSEDGLNKNKNKYRNYSIEFSNGSDLSTKGCTQIYLDLFDISVVNTEGCEVDENGRITSGTGKLEEGRIWSYAWNLNTNGETNKTYTSFYTKSNDDFVSKVYLDGFEPYQFVVACNSYGSEFTNNCEEDRKSKLKPQDAPYDKIPEYQVFLTNPDPEYWGKAKLPNVPDKLTFAGDAMTCEDLIFVVKLLYNENATLELYMDTDQDGITDKVIAALLQANIIKDRGFHYPWKDRTQLQDTCSTCDTSWHGEGIGWGKYYYNPAVDGCARRYTLSLFDQSYSYTYTYVDEKGDSYPNTKDRVNPGDSLRTIPELIGTEDPEGNLPNFSPTYPIGTEQNPVLITSASELQKLNSAVANGGSYEQCIDKYFHYWEGSTEKYAKYCYSISQAGSNAGFRNTYFYITAPTGSIVLENWDGIGTATNPFKGHIRAGRYMPNPASDNLSETTASLAGDQDTIIINGTNGLFAFCDGATIENIHVKGSITANSFSSKFDDSYLNDFYPYSEDVRTVGGICDYATNTVFSHCSNKCQINVDEDELILIAGGILGTGTNCILDSCSNYANITASYFAGGIAGYLRDTSSVNFCYNVANVRAEGHSAGGIVGLAINKLTTDGQIINSKNEGYTYGEMQSGGIVGKTEGNYWLSSCFNQGFIASGQCAAGISSSEDNNIDVDYCYNRGDVDGEVTSWKIAPSHHATQSVSVNSEGSYYVTGSSSTGYDATDLTPEIKEQISLKEVSGVSDITGEDTTYFENDESPFYMDVDGNLQMFTTECCGRTFHQEDAGRLFNSNTTFYIKWDGKDSEGECVTGDVTVSYQKNSGVTHFPFYDPEYNRKAHGLVVYRISPIQDTITGVAPRKVLMRKADKEEWIAESNVTDSTAKGWEIVPGVDPKPAQQTAYQAANGITDPSYYGYTNLPKNYFGNSETIPDEKGIELKLFWDDTNIQMSGGGCEDEVISVPNGDPTGYIFGESVTSGGVFESKCTNYKTKNNKGKTVSMCQSGYEKSSLDAPSIKYCTRFTSTYGGTNLNKCVTWSTVKTANGSTNCVGISNLGSSDVWSKTPNKSKSDKTGGYYGSTAGGHMFPKDKFGDKNTMNTWWNGVEVKQLVPLKLTAYEPAVLMPIEMTMWTATSLEESVLLEWTTASEENNDYFAIERSIDGVTWKVLGNVGGAGTTSATHYYSFEDTKPVSGISYYRLKQVDFNGEYTYSSVKCINRPANADKMYKAYVNKDIDAFIVQGEEIAACNIEVYNNLGVKMTNLSFNPISTDKVVINVGQLPIGTYFIKICNGSKSVVKSW